jgi:hypothetical protein
MLVQSLREMYAHWHVPRWIPFLLKGPELHRSFRNRSLFQNKFIDIGEVLSLESELLAKLGAQSTTAIR